MTNESSSERMVAAVLCQDGRILMCHRRAGRHRWSDSWDLPGGHVEVGESTSEALVREVEEELGIRVEPHRHPPWLTLRSEQIELHLYVVDQWSGEVRNTAPDEHDELRWVTADELPTLPLADYSYVEVLGDVLSAHGR